jgi:hypothetical protein
MTKLLNKILLFLLFLLFAIGFFHPITAFTQDLGRHILLGKIIMQDFSVPKTNLLTYTYPDFPFINHHWLSEVIFYLVDEISGANGLLIITVSTVLATVFILVQYLFKKTSVAAIAIVFLVFHFLLFERTDVRPEIFSFLFLVLFITVLYRYKEKPTRQIFLLPFIELLWVNTHVYFPVGLIVIAAFITDDVLIRHNKIIQLIKKKSFPQSTKILLISFFLSLFATLFNPNFISGALYPLRVFNNYGYTVVENQSAWFLWYNFSFPSIPLFAGVVTVLLLSLIFTVKKTAPVDWFLSLFFAVFAALYIRNIPLLVFGAFIPFAKSLDIILRYLSKKLLRYSLEIYRLTTASGLIFLIGLTCFFIQQRITTRPIGFGTDPGATNAADFYINQHIKGPVFNNFDIGSYFEYRLYPTQRAFIDGRPEAFPKEFIQNVYIPDQREQKTFDQLDNTYHFNSIFFSHTDQTPWALQFIQMITKHSKWKLVYVDDTVMIFVKDTLQNQEVIKQFGMADDLIHASNSNEHDKNSLMRLAYFYKRALLQNQEKDMYHKILDLDPHDCYALYNLAALLSNEQNSAYTMYLDTFQKECQ